MRLIPLSELKVNDILDQDIENSAEVIIVSSGTRITNAILNRILDLQIDYIYIKDHNSRSEPEPEPVSLSFEEKLNNEFSTTVDSFKNVFMSAKFGEKIVIDEFRASIKPLVSEIAKNNNILGNLRKIKRNDAYTYKHSINVGLISVMLGKWLNYTENDLTNLVIAGMLHDIGKCKIPSHIINKQGPLNDSEFEIIKSHSDLGYELLCETDNISDDVKLGVRQHHERFNGSGYPFGIKGCAIHEFGRVIAIADIFDAMTSDRSYKSKMSPFTVAEYIRDLSFTHLDPNLTSVFLKKIGTFYVGNIVRLNDGNNGEVILVNESNHTKPLIKVGSQFIDLSKDFSVKIIDVLE